MNQETILSFNRLLESQSLHIAFAESITAGLLSATVASISGASSVLKGGVVCYDKALKIKLLGVRKETLDLYGAESPETTLEMAAGLAALLPEAQIAVAITGSASDPVNGYSMSAPVGSVFLCVGLRGNFHSYNNQFSGNRAEVLDWAVQFAFSTITNLLQKQV